MESGSSAALKRGVPPNMAFLDRRPAVVATYLGAPCEIGGFHRSCATFHIKIIILGKIQGFTAWIGEIWLCRPLAATVTAQYGGFRCLFA